MRGIKAALVSISNEEENKSVKKSICLLCFRGGVKREERREERMR